MDRSIRVSVKCVDLEIPVLGVFMGRDEDKRQNLKRNITYKKSMKISHRYFDMSTPKDRREESQGRREF